MRAAGTKWGKNPYMLKQSWQIDHWRLGEVDRGGTTTSGTTVDHGGC
jgi:hypothetical protein